MVDISDIIQIYKKSNTYRLIIKEEAYNLIVSLLKQKPLENMMQFEKAVAIRKKIVEKELD